MENKKYTKGTKFYIFRMTGSGRWTKYVDALKDDEKELLQYALCLKYVALVNDAPRGCKHGEHFLVKKYFTTASILEESARLFLGESCFYFLGTVFAEVWHSC